MAGSSDGSEAQAPPQGFERLLPFAEAKARLLEVVRPVALQDRPAAAAIGFTLAADLRAPQPEPAARVAAQDGYAVSSHDTVGATPYAPVYAGRAVAVVWAGDPLAEECDAVLPADGVVLGPAGAEILQAAAPGAGTREAGHDLAAQATIARAGERLRPDRAALLAMAGVAEVPVRVPRFRVEGDGPVRRMVEALVAGGGGRVADGAEADASVVLAGQGHAATAAAARNVAERGTLLAHGIAVAPARAMGFGTVAGADGRSRVVFVVPSRPEEVLAAWLLLIQPCLAALAGQTQALRTQALPLTRKIVSAPGLAELVLLRRAAGSKGWEPLAVGDLPWSALAAADAYALIPAQSEGIAAGGLLSAASLELPGAAFSVSTAT